jgi:hypothetical protein
MRDARVAMCSTAVGAYHEVPRASNFPVQPGVDALPGIFTKTVVKVGTVDCGYIGYTSN